MILDEQAGAPFAPGYRDFNRLARPELDRVRDQVRQHLIQARAVPATHQMGLRIDRERGTALFELWTEPGHDFPYDLLEIHVLVVQVESSGPESAKLEKLVHELR